NDAPSVASDMSIDFSCVVKFQEKVCTGSGGENRCGFLGAYRERTNAGLEAARARGKKGGRPKSLDQPKNITLLKQMHADPNYSISDICKTLDISRSTFYRYLKSDNNENGQ
ncbi:helix-turn-helix domain-containing protein, partial [Thiolapillus sp.]